MYVQTITPVAVIFKVVFAYAYCYEYVVILLIAFRRPQ